MSEEDIRALVALEYDFIAVDAAMGMLLDRLTPIPLIEEEIRCECVEIRNAVRSLLAKLDKPITEAVRLYETLEEAPF